MNASTGRRTRGIAAVVGSAAAMLVTCVPAAAQQPTPEHVAIVVDGAGTACVPWHAGMTGADVLTARFDVTWGQPTPSGNYAGMVVQINGTPTDPNPHTAYWAYFHNSGSGWQYSGSGALSTHPQPGTVEGWRLDSAASSSPPAPVAASYASICAGQDPTPAPSTHARTSTAPSHAVKPAAAHRTSAAVGPSSTSNAPARTHPSRPTASSTPTRSPRPSTAVASTNGPVASSTMAAPASTASSTPAALTHHGGGGIPPWRTALAIVVVLALGSVAFWRTRR